MLSELAIGRSTGFGPVNAYKKVSKKFKWIGWLAIIAPFLIMTFYSVLGGYCIYYMVINVVGMFSGMPDSSSFAALLTNPWASIGCMVLFMVICYLINRGGVGGGIDGVDHVRTHTAFGTDYGNLDHCSSLMLSRTRMLRMSYVCRAHVFEIACPRP